MSELGFCISGVVEFDIKGLFDNLSHDLLMKAVKHHVSDKWILLLTLRTERVNKPCFLAPALQHDWIAQSTYI